MRCSLLPAMVIGFSALVQATFSSPKAGDSWVKGQENTISWDSKSVSGLIDISCVPAGAKDTTVIIAQIATQIDSSSGSRKWTPDKSISAQSVTIIIVDSKKSYTVSETLILIDVESSSSNKGSGKGGNDYNSGKNNGNDYNSGKNNGNDYNSGKNNGNDYNSGKGKNATETKSSESEKTKSYEPMVTHSMKNEGNSTKETKSMGVEMTMSKESGTTISKEMGMTISKEIGMTKSEHSVMKTESAAQQVTNSIIIAISTGTVATQTEAGPAAVIETSKAVAATVQTTLAVSTAAPIFAANTSSLFFPTGTGSAPARVTAFTGGASTLTLGGSVFGGLFGVVVALIL